MNKLYIIIFVQFIIILIFGFINIKLTSTTDALNKDPLKYAAGVYDINFCSCFTDNKANFFFNKSAVWQEIKRASPQYIFNLNESG